MKPPPMPKREYEKVKIDDWIAGTIEDINYKDNHTFKYKGVEKVSPAVRFKFKLNNYEYPHYSKWMFFGYGEKAVLFQKFLSPLVKNASPEMDFDLDHLKGFEIKTMWSEKGDFQNLEMVRPLGEKLGKGPVGEELAEVSEDDHNEEVPF